MDYRNMTEVQESPFSNTYGGLSLYLDTDTVSHYLVMQDCTGEDYFGPLTPEQVRAFYILCGVSNADSQSEAVGQKIASQLESEFTAQLSKLDITSPGLFVLSASREITNCEYTLCADGLKALDPQNTLVTLSFDNRDLSRMTTDKASDLLEKLAGAFPNEYAKHVTGTVRDQML